MLTFDEGWDKWDETEYKDEYKIFCNWSFQVFLMWMRTWYADNRSINVDTLLPVIVSGLVTRDSALELSRMNVTGTPISFPIIRPMIGRKLDRKKFVKERRVHLTKGRGYREVAKTALGAATTIKNALLGTSSEDTQKVNETIIDAISVGGRFLLQSGDSQQSIIFGVVRNEMRGFLVRTRDVIGILSNITDELTRQQRKAEFRMRDVKRSLRQRFNANPLDSGLLIAEKKQVAKKDEFRSGTRAIARNLMNEVLDVSIHISLGYYYIYKIWSEMEDGLSKIAERNNEDIGDVRENRGELEIMHSMMWYFEDESSSFSLYKLAREAARRAAQFFGNKEYVEQLKFAFRSYEQDLRDGIQDVELALSAYRMRIDAENELFNLVGINGLTIQDAQTFSGPGASVPASVPASDSDSDSDSNSDEYGVEPEIPDWPPNGFGF